MTDQPDELHDDQVARRLKGLPDAKADPRFAEELRKAFVSGDFEARRTEVPPSFLMWRWVGVATAAALVVFALALLNRGPAWQVADVAGASALRIDGAPYAPGKTNDMERALRWPVRLDIPADGRLDLLLPEVALFEVTGGTRMTLPDRPGRWIGRAVSCSLFVGELRLKTGARYAGTTLRVHTPDGMVEVTGTLLSVQCDESGTCVCVLEGTARVGLDADRLDPVTPGFRKIMLKDGTVEIIPVKTMHAEGVLDFNQRMGGRLDKDE